jgi:GDSL-like lipase/acylhydrolase family protein
MKRIAKFLGLTMFSFIMLTGCNLAQANIQSGIIQATTTPSIDLTAQVLPQIPVTQLPEPVMVHVRDIIAVGQSRNNRANVFSKVGDSITVSRSFLYSFGNGNYDLGDYDYLQTAIDFYQNSSARTGNSFLNTSLAAGEGWAAWGILSVKLADSNFCGVGEIPLVCEYRIVRPSVAIIMFGTNDVGYRTGGQFRANMTQIVTISIEMGVVPILSTFPNRPDEAERVRIFNNIIRDIAQEQAIPLIDYYELTKTLPNYGLTRDNIHPSTPPSGYTAAAIFSDNNLRYGYTVRNLATLETLYSLISYLNP